MIILGIESSSKTGSVALVEDGILLGEFRLFNQKTHSQTLMPMLSALLEEMNKKPSDIDAIAISRGPGSFTGLRIGSGMAKGLALALDIDIIPVSTLESMAYLHFGYSGLICPMMDARRGNVYSGLYMWKQGKLEVIKEEGLYHVEEYVEYIKALMEEKNVRLLCSGDGLKVWENYLREKVSELDIPPHFAQVESGGAVASLGFIYQDKKMSSLEFVPLYLRSTQAEREKQEGVHHYQQHI